MSDDIVTRLRRFADVKSFPQGGKFLAFEDLLEAADEIERLRAEVDRLKALWCEARSQAMTFHEELEKFRKESRP